MSARCERKGHAWKKEARSGFSLPDDWHFRCVADSFTEERTFCRRWGCYEVTEWVTIDSHCIQSLSMGESDWVRLRRDRWMVSS